MGQNLSKSSMLKISFDFDELNKTVSNIKVVTVDNTPKEDNIDKAILEVSDCKLVFSSKALKLMNVNYGDRIAVNYVQQNNEVTFPVVGKSNIFADPNAGNKVTKTNTVSFKGTQKDLLLKYGQKFELEEYKPGMFKLKTIN